MKISYKLNARGQVILKSLQKITDKQLKTMSDSELKKINLYRDFVGGCFTAKFYPIDYKKYLKEQLS